MKLARYRYYLFAVLFGILYSFSFLESGTGRYEMFDMINRLGFSEFLIEPSYLQNFFIWYFHFFVFQMMYGTYIYKHFCTACVYYFCRMNNRIRWFLKETLKLFANSLIYVILLFLMYIGFGSIFGSMIVTKEAIIFLGYYIILHSTWLFITALLVNICSIWWDSSKGFTIVYSVQLVFIILYAALQSYLRFDIGDIEQKSKILKLNPISHLVLKWHSSQIQSINSKINIFRITFDLNESVCVYAIMSVLVFGIGCFVVKKQDFILNNRETGGAE